MSHSCFHRFFDLFFRHFWGNAKLGQTTYLSSGDWRRRHITRRFGILVIQLIMNYSKIGIYLGFRVLHFLIWDLNGLFWMSLSRSPRTIIRINRSGGWDSIWPILQQLSIECFKNLFLIFLNQTEKNCRILNWKFQHLQPKKQLQWSYEVKGLLKTFPSFLSCWLPPKIFETPQAMGEQSLQSLAIQMFLGWVGGQATKFAKHLHLQGCEMMGKAAIKDP